MNRELDALDKALEFGASFDWITPLESLLSGNPRLCVYWDEQGAADTALSGVGVDRLNRILKGDFYSFNVRKGDYSKATSELKRAGVTAWKV